MGQRFDSFRTRHSSNVRRSSLRNELTTPSGGFSSVGRVLDCDSSCRGFEPLKPPHFFSFSHPLLSGSGEIGRHAGFRFQCVSVRVQVPPSAPEYGICSRSKSYLITPYKLTQFFECPKITVTAPTFFHFHKTNGIPFTTR